MNRSPYGYTVIFDIFKDDKLTHPMIIVKRIGQIFLMIAALGLLVIQVNTGQVGGALVYTIASAAVAYGFFLGVICFTIVAAYSLGKNKATTTAQAIGGTFLKVLLYIFLPAVIITLLLVAIFGLPQYR